MKYSTRTDSLSDLILSSERLLREDIPKGFIDLAASVPPFPVPGALLNSAQDIIRSENMNYTPTPGLLSLRKLLAEKRGCPEGEKQVTITTGTTEALFCSLAACLESGDECLIPELALKAHVAAVSFFGGVVRRYPVDFNNSEQQIVKAVSERLTDQTRVVIVNNPLIATGQIISKEEFDKLAEICCQRNIMVLVDESFLGISFNGSKKSKLYGNHENVIAYTGMTKLFNMSGLRIGWIFSSAEVSSVLNSVRYIISTCANTLSQRIALRMMDGKGDQSRDKLLGILSSRRRLMIDSLRQNGLEHFPEPAAGYYIFLNYQAALKDKYNSKSFAQLLRDRKSLIVTPGSVFGTAGDGHIRISYTASEENIQKAIKYIKELVDELNL